VTPTDKQIAYVLSLLARAGYDTRHMGRGHKELGATMSERSGTVEDWLRGCSRQEISELIDRLKAAPVR
jgi:hypothetical protein